MELADLPATARPVIGVSSAPLASTGSSTARINKWAQLLLSTNEPVPLPPEVFENWLASGRTNAADLLAARQAGGGKKYLLMALEKFPNDPRVLMAAVALDDSPEARRERLDRLRTVAPENALGDYLSARDHFKAGRVEQAIADLQSATGKGQFQDYMVDAIQNTEELLLQAGKSPAEAKALASTSALLPQMAQVKGLAQDIAALQRQYTAAGDHASAESLALVGLELSDHLTAGDGSRTLLGQLVGMAIDRLVVSPLDPERSYDFLDGTIPQHFEKLQSRRSEVKENAKAFEQWLSNANDADVMSYFDRLKLYGENDAMRWMRQRMAAP